MKLSSLNNVVALARPLNSSESSFPHLVRSLGELVEKVFRKCPVHIRWERNGSCPVCKINRCVQISGHAGDLVPPLPIPSCHLRHRPGLFPVPGRSVLSSFPSPYSVNSSVRGCPTPWLQRVQTVMWMISKDESEFCLLSVLPPPQPVFTLKSSPLM